MHNWEVIVWLICFFPYGLYNMFTQTNWGNEQKYILTVTGTILLGISLIKINFYELLLVSGLVLFTTGAGFLLYSLIYRTGKKNASLMLIYGLIFLLLAGTHLEQEVPKRHARPFRIEQLLCL